MTGLNNNNNYQYPNLPISIIWPDNTDDVPWFMMRLYEQMSFAINQKDNGIFQMAISDTATRIPNLDSTGSYLINISGSDPFIDVNGNLNYWPTAIIQLTKSDPNAVGVFTITQTQDGAGATLGNAPGPAAFVISQQQVPSVTGPYFAFIRHNMTGLVGSFNVNIQGTRL